uniref:Ribosomal protein S9 n=1 Tax=Agarophyton chilense TaxID=2510777 RepID=A0A141SEX6_AGACH|nr:ribosomal protein S9 [Agarophyton chilense]AMK96844.1 ribosomal protein S9 [Agarophyton chilense]ASP44738.1 30S ribosomal protein S9 [Agarophyton chilense]UAD84430.1 ribosomal protein S9 [Agarophyton chilense]|eukprot:gb/GEZJ01006828.1/.p1 GENE.gb/GEZJ01006828.1/~~gb/GEZJ01006828.1/.p1  ORF type:complete len:138 (-),score=1.16 gb/GEZJ01006828.1/:120-533(-)
MTTLTKNSKIIYAGTGRRKTSIARVKLVPGSGKLIINGLPGESYLQFSPNYLRVSYAPLKILGLNKEYDIYVKTEGGGLTGQANAIRLGLARALCRMNPDNRTTMKAEGFLTRDARIKERKKYGLRKARKAPQYSKR